MLRIASWNVNGVRACCKNGFLDWFAETGFDVVSLQEVRADEAQVPPELLGMSGYHKLWFSAQKKGYSGVGILSREKPANVILGLGVDEFDSEGRVLTAEFANFFAVSAYFPNSQGAGLRIDYKVRFCREIHRHVNKLRAKGKVVILSGDYNIAHQAIDLARPAENEETAGYLPQEREWMGEFLGSGWVDTFRMLHPEARDRYSWWSMRTRARPRNIGWRIDYHCVAEQDRHLVQGADILDKVTGSDHCPVTLDLDL